MYFHKTDADGKDYLGVLTPADVVGLQYEHIQTVPSVEWVVVHNLGKYPSVIILDEESNEVFASIVHTSKNILSITFSSAQVGKVICN